MDCDGTPIHKKLLPEQRYNSLTARPARYRIHDEMYLSAAIQLLSLSRNGVDPSNLVLGDVPRPLPTGESYMNWAPVEIRLEGLNNEVASMPSCRTDAASSPTTRRSEMDFEKAHGSLTDLCIISIVAPPSERLTLRSTNTQK